MNKVCSKCKEEKELIKNKPWCRGCLREYGRLYARKRRDLLNPNRERRSPVGQKTPLCSNCKKIKEKINRSYCNECELIKNKEWEKNRPKRLYEGKYAEQIKKSSREWRRKNKDLVNLKIQTDRLIDPEKYRERDRKWRKNNLERDRYNDILTKHKITKEQYDKLLKQCNNLCQICGNPENRKSRTKGLLMRLALDHCHDCSNNGHKGILTIRGMLCGNCNAGIGHFKNSVKLLISAAKFVKKHNCIK